MEILGVTIQSGRFCSPFRNDSHPTCSMTKTNSGKLLYMDWAMFAEPKDVFDMYIHLYGGGFTEAVAGIWSLFENEFLGKRSATPTIEVTQQEDIKLEVSHRPWEPKDLRWWAQQGIDKEVLGIFHSYPIQTMWLRETVHYNRSSPMVNPGYVYHFGVKDIKVYFPFKDTNRFFQNNGKILQGYAQLPAKGRMLVITKSLKDVMLLYSFGISAVAPMSETVPISEEMMIELKIRFSKIIVLFDADCAGVRGLRKFKDLGLRTQILKKDWGAKDLTDFRVKYGAETTFRLVTEYKESLLDGAIRYFNFKV